MGLNSRISSQIRKMPKYKIQDEVWQSKNIALGEAFGKDRDIQMAQEDIESNVAAGGEAAKDVTSSTSALLGALTDLYSSGFEAKRDLAKYEAGDLRRGKIQNLYGVNEMVAEEKDKAWRQNVYAPWEARLRELQDKRNNRRQMVSSIAGGLLTAGGMVLAGPLGGLLAGGLAKSATSSHDSSPGSLR